MVYFRLESSEAAESLTTLSTRQLSVVIEKKQLGGLKQQGAPDRRISEGDCAGIFYAMIVACR